MRFSGLVVAFALAVCAASASAEEPGGTVAAISDIHFDPFAAPGIASRLRDLPVAGWPGALAAQTGPLADYGADSNGPLVSSALQRFGGVVSGADVVVMPGDMLGHDFNEKAAKAFGGGEQGPAVHAFAARTTRAMIAAVAAIADAPVVFALGNEDAACGDYEIEPGGGYLAAIAGTVRAAAGTVADDFGETFRHGGWFAMPHPHLANGRIVVLNTVLWSARYENTCGEAGAGEAAATAQLAWLEKTLDAARYANAPVWIVAHIPLGIDAYSSVAQGAACKSSPTAFLRPDAQAALSALFAEHADTIRAIFNGHTHHDSYRLTGGDEVAKIIPSISPIFGNNPGLQRFTYNASGTLTHMATVALDLPSATWGEETTFAATYGVSFSAGAVREIATGVRDAPTAPQSLRFASAYPLGHAPPSGVALRSVACAIDTLAGPAFEACLCPASQ